MDGLTVTELHTQDGWDWPNGVSDERWPAQADRRPLPPPNRLTVRASEHERHCTLADCRCARYGLTGSPARGCDFYHP